MKNINAGLTIIELLVIVLIIGILAVITVPNLINARSRGYDVVALNCAYSLSRAVALYKTQNLLNTAIPDATSFYGDDTKGDEYGTHDCNALSKTGANVIVSTAGSNWNYAVRHPQGRFTYTVSNLGITKQ